MDLPRLTLLLAAAFVGAACTALPPSGTARNRVAEGPRSKANSHVGCGPDGIAVIDVRHCESAVPPGARVAALRVVEFFPRDNAWPDVPRIGYACGTLARGVLGTVAVEADGSACFEVPSGIDVAIQAMDERGRALLTIRSGMRLHPGETRVCDGPHDFRRGGPPAADPVPLALRKPPARLEPDSPGSYPMSFARLVQPVLDRQCIGCHDGRSGRPDLRPHLFETENKEEIPRLDRLCGVECLNNGWSHGYADLREHAWFTADREGIGPVTERGAGPAEIGARASRLMQMLDGGHGCGILAEEDSHRIALWLDCGSPFYGAYHEADLQARGGLVPPRLGYLPKFEN